MILSATVLEQNAVNSGQSSTLIADFEASSTIAQYPPTFTSLSEHSPYCSII